MSSDAKEQWDKIPEIDKAKILKYANNCNNNNNNSNSNKVGTSTFRKKPDRNKKPYRSNVHEGDTEEFNDNKEDNLPNCQPAIEVDKLLSLVSWITRKDSRRVRPVDLLVEISCGDSIRL